MKSRQDRFILIGALFFLVHISTYAQKEIAITIDDPKTNETPSLDWLERDNRILNTLDKHKIKVALFVCGMRVDDIKGKALLSKWDRKEHLICNHSYSHLYYNSKSITSQALS